MYHHLLVPTDGSPLSDEVICQAVGLPREPSVRRSTSTPDRTLSYVFDARQSTYYRHLPKARRGAGLAYPDRSGKSCGRVRC